MKGRIAIKSYRQNPVEALDVMAEDIFGFSFFGMLVLGGIGGSDELSGARDLDSLRGLRWHCICAALRSSARKPLL